MVLSRYNSLNFFMPFAWFSIKIFFLKLVDKGSGSLFLWTEAVGQVQDKTNRIQQKVVFCFCQKHQSLVKNRSSLDSVGTPHEQTAFSLHSPDSSAASPLIQVAPKKSCG